MKRIKVSEAAKILGVSSQFVRLGLQRGTLPIGTAVKMSSKWTYYINPHLLELYLGIDIPDQQNTICNKMPPVTATTDGKTADDESAERTW